MVSYLDRLIAQSALLPAMPDADSLSMSTRPTVEPSAPADLEIDQTRVVSPATASQPDPYPPGRGRDAGVAAGEPPAPAVSAERPRPADGAKPTSQAPDRPGAPAPVEVAPPRRAAESAHLPSADIAEESAAEPSIPPGSRRTADPPSRHRDVLVQRVIDWVVASVPPHVPVPEAATPAPEPPRPRGDVRAELPAHVAVSSSPVASTDPPVVPRETSPVRPRPEGVAVQRSLPDEPPPVPGRMDSVQVRIDAISLHIDQPRPQVPPPRPPTAALAPRPRVGGTDGSDSRLARRYIRP